MLKVRSYKMGYDRIHGYTLMSFQFKVSITDSHFINLPLQSGASLVQRPLSHLFVLDPNIV